MHPPAAVVTLLIHFVIGQGTTYGTTKDYKYVKQHTHAHTNVAQRKKLVTSIKT